MSIYNAHEGAINALKRYSESILLSGGEDFEIKFWDMKKPLEKSFKSIRFPQEFFNLLPNSHP